MPRKGCLFSLFATGRETVKELPYEQREGILTQAELSFYHVLLQALEIMGLRAMVCPKVGLRDVFRVVTQDNSEYTACLNKIDRKHVDFLLCDPRGMGLIAGVELDDSTHLSERARARDVFVEQVYQAAGLPLLRFRVRHEYDIRDMVRYMRQELAITGTAAMEKNEAAEKAEAGAVEAGDAVSHAETEAQAVHEESAAAAPERLNTPLCPRCGAPMVLRRARRGKRKGQYFWGCSRFPRCRCVADMKVSAKAQ